MAGGISLFIKIINFISLIKEMVEYITNDCPPKKNVKVYHDYSKETVNLKTVKVTTKLSNYEIKA